MPYQIKMLQLFSACGSLTKKQLIKQLTFFLLCCTCVKIYAKDVVLFDASKRYFSITTAESSVAEQQAAKLLQRFLNEQSKYSWPILAMSSNKTNQIIITEIKLEVTKFSQFCTISVKQQNIYLSADSALLRTCVAFFLENFAGTKVCSDVVTYAPKLTKCVIPDTYNKTYSPAFKSRVLFERSAFDTLFSAWHGLSNIPGPLDHRRTFTWGIMAHSFLELVPPDQYFSSHPEYFALHGGKRVAEQLCLSNKDILKIAVANLTKMMAQRPDMQNWSVSQMDNQSYCECSSCAKIAQDEKSQSGPIIRFVNEVATYFPNKTIGTLAYQYSRKAPSKTKAGKNVVVTLCSIESDRSKPLNDPKQKDDFAGDLRNWSAMCSTMMVWDYTINFISIATPFPNFHVLQPNLQYFKKMDVKMMFEQGWHATGSGLQEYRAYLLAKLLWDPYLNVNSIKSDFFKAYYGKAGTYLMQVVDLMQEKLIASGQELGIYEYPSGHSKGYLTPQLSSLYLATLNKALSAVANDPILYKRVDAFAQAFRLAEVELNGAIIGSKAWVDKYTIPQRINFKQKNDSLLNEFVDKSKSYGPVTMLENRLTPEEWRYLERNLFKKDVEDNLVAGAVISYKYPYNHMFATMGPQALVDGSLGTDNWSSTWLGWFNSDIDATLKLKSNISMSSISMRFMKDPDFDIGVPKYLLVMASSDGIAYREIAKIEQPVLKNQTEKEIVNFKVNFKTPISTRYLHIIAKCPDFVLNKNIKHPPFVFSDEIYVR